MKKNIVLILTVILIMAMLVWLNCNPLSQNEKAQTDSFSVLDDTNGTRLTVTCAIEVNGTTYDGGGETIISDIYDFERSGYPVFRVTNGAVKNVVITHTIDGACGGAWLFGGNCTIENITMSSLSDAAAVSVRKPGIYSVSNCTFNGSSDRPFQINDLCDITYKNIKANYGDRLIRQNGGTTWKCTVYIDTANLTNFGTCIGRSDSAVTTFFYRNITCNLPQNQWWYTGTKSAAY